MNKDNDSLRQPSPLKDVDSFTSDGAVDLETLEKMKQNAIDMIAASFMGIPVHVDDRLTGMSYYIAVSPELEEVLKRE